MEKKWTLYKYKDKRGFVRTRTFNTLEKAMVAAEKDFIKGIVPRLISWGARNYDLRLMKKWWSENDLKEA